MRIILRVQTTILIRLGARLFLINLVFAELCSSVTKVPTVWQPGFPFRPFEMG